MKQVMYKSKECRHPEMVIANNKRVPKPCLTHEKNDNFVLNKSGRRHQRKIKIYAVRSQVGHNR